MVVGEGGIRKGPVLRFVRVSSDKISFSNMVAWIPSHPTLSFVADALLLASTFAGTKSPIPPQLPPFIILVLQSPSPISDPSVSSADSADTAVRPSKLPKKVGRMGTGLPVRYVQSQSKTGDKHHSKQNGFRQRRNFYLSEQMVYAVKRMEMHMDRVESRNCSWNRQYEKGVAGRRVGLTQTPALYLSRLGVLALAMVRRYAADYSADFGR